MPLCAILIPRITGADETKVTPASASEIRRASAFPTVGQLPHAGGHTYDFIDRLASTVPGYSLELGRDLNKVPRAISDLPAARPRCRPEHHAPRSIATPLVSVIVPVFNGERFIDDAVQSILSQHYPAVELLIVDDGSTDRTAEIVSQLPGDLRYFKQGNAGPAAARNQGIRNASGEIVAFLDVDDLWPDNTLHVLVDELVRDPDLDVIHGYNQLMSRNPHTGEYERIGNPKEGFRYSIAAAVFRKSVFTKVGLFDTTLIFGEDRDWFVRASESGVKIRRIDGVTLLVRRHDQNMTHGKNGVELNGLRVFKNALDRRRAMEARAKGDVDQNR
jgi:hypothetical protein